MIATARGYNSAPGDQYPIGAPAPQIDRSQVRGGQSDIRPTDVELWRRQNPGMALGGTAQAMQPPAYAGPGQPVVPGQLWQGGANIGGPTPYGGPAIPPQQLGMPGAPGYDLGGAAAVMGPPTPQQQYDLSQIGPVMDYLQGGGQLPQGQMGNGIPMQVPEAQAPNVIPMYVPPYQAPNYSYDPRWRREY